MTGVFEPLIPRELRLEVPERLDYAGRVLTALDEAAVAAAARLLLDSAARPSSSTSSTLTPTPPTSSAPARSSAPLAQPLRHAGPPVVSEYREYERGTTAAVNACVQPVLHRYLESLRAGLASEGFGAELLVMQGNGGTVSARIAAEEAAKTVMSGPASGVMAAAYLGSRAGFPDLITYDMGGTSTDVALIRGGVPSVTDELELEYAMPVHVPMVDVHTVGAGGGSIARGRRRRPAPRRPRERRRRPRPGRLRPRRHPPHHHRREPPPRPPRPRQAPRRRPPRDLARDRQAIDREVGRHLGLTPEQAAAAILRVANDRMAGAVRMVSLARGHDPRDYALFAFGGAGPLHASALARELGIPRSSSPPAPASPTRSAAPSPTSATTSPAPSTARWSGSPPRRSRPSWRPKPTRACRTLDREGVQVAETVVLHTADMQFRGQTHLLNVPLHRATPDPATLRASFERAYFDRFGIELPEIGAVLVNLKTSVIGRRPELDPALLAASAERAADVEGARVGERRVWFEAGWQVAPVYRRERIPLEVPFAGPAIVEQLDATTVLEPGDMARQDRTGNLIVHVD
jgi:N-methylhydantoinase A